MKVKRETCRVKTGSELNEWKLVETKGIAWVRLVHDRSGVHGIGFYHEQLVYFLGTQITHGLVRRVSAFRRDFLHRTDVRLGLRGRRRARPRRPS